MSTDPTTVVIIGLTAIFGLIGGAAGILVAAKSLMQGKKPGDEYITRNELQKLMNDIEKKIDAVRDSVNRESLNLKTDLVARIDKMDNYHHTNAHEMANSLHGLTLKTERLLAMNEAQKQPHRPWTEEEQKPC